MGIYSHQTDAQLIELRDKYTASLNERLTQPVASGWGDKRIQYDQAAIKELRAALVAVTAEINQRSGQSVRGPIYLV